jgi:hypothetical protein
MILPMVGHAVAPYRSGRDTIVTGLAELSAGIQITVAPRVRLSLAAALGTTFTQPVVRFAGRSVAEWSSPHGRGEAGIGVAW